MDREDVTKEQLIKDLIRLRQRTSELEQLEDEQKRSSEELIRIKSMYQGLFEFATDAIVVVNRAGMIVQANSRAEQLFGYTMEEMLNHSVEMLMPERFQKRHVEHRRGYVTEPRVRVMGKGLELYGRRKDGREFPVDIALGPLETGRETLFLSVIRDFTDYKSLEKTFLESQERYRKLVELSPDAVFIQSEDKVIFANNAGVKLLGASEPGQLLGKSIWDFIHPDYREIVKERTRRIKEEGVDAPLMEEKIVRLDGTVIDVEVAATPFSHQGKPAILAAVHDITQRKRFEAELTRSNKELEHYAHVVSHDLQEPLISLIGYCQLFHRRYKEKFDAEAEKFIISAIELGNKMQRLIKGILTYSRVGSCGGEFTKTDFNQILKETLTGMSQSLQTKGGVVTYDPLPVLRVDREQMGRVFQNLIDNGMKFCCDKPPRIHVSAKQEGNNWVFSLRDNGIGINPEYFDRIFAMFERAHATSDFPGTGIGLAVCKKIIERHGGHIWVESELNKGSTFYFKLPEKPEG